MFFLPQNNRGLSIGYHVESGVEVKNQKSAFRKKIVYLSKIVKTVKKLIR